MAIKVKSKIVPVWYTPKSEEKEENPASFKLKPLNGLEYTDVIANTSNDAGGESKLSERGVRLAIKHGLLDAKNLIDEHGNEIKLKHVGHGVLPMNILIELAGQIIDLSSMSDDDIKN